MKALEHGLLQVYTGNSGRFNFAPLGMSFRAAGQNLRSMITCFLPHALMEGAERVAMFLNPYVVIDHPHEGGEGCDADPTEERVHQSFENAAAAVKSGAFDIVILNDMNTVLSRGMISLQRLLTVIESKPPHVELVLTGPGAPDEIIARADMVTYMKVHGAAGGAGAERESSGKGNIEVITGHGKGKTTYCLGKTLLSACLGVRSTMIQFIKSPKPFGEVKALERFPLFKLQTMGEGFVDPRSSVQMKKHIDAARKAWERCLREIFSLEYGMVVLDEINNATFYGLVKAESVRQMCALKPRSLDLLLSGRHPHAEVLAAASVVIEMKEIKHPFRKGIRARKGIEF